MTTHIFVLGLGPFHEKYLKTIPDGEQYEFHALLKDKEVLKLSEYSCEQMLQTAGRRIRDFREPIGGIITHWDFPASTLLPILCQQFGFRCASPEAVLKCEHKYWSRLNQQEAVPGLTPEFCAVDPFAAEPYSQVTIDFPFWIKPVKAFGSHLGFRIDNRRDFNHSIQVTRRKIRRVGEPFNVALSHAELPKEIERIDGNCCIAEQIVNGKQCGIEGYMLDGKFAVHGVVDGVKDSRNLSFTRWEYPSAWPREVCRRMNEAAEKLMKHLGYDNAPFGVEFFWEEDTDELRILEVNTRISQSHSDQFIKVKGTSNHETAVAVATGREPDFDSQCGPYECAAKFMLRRYEDVVVTRVPSEAQIRAAEGAIPDAKVRLVVEAGTQLSDIRDQDSYSYEIANVWLGAQTQNELLDKYQELAKQLPFEFSDGKPVEPFQFQKVRY
jgi:biotin carboxylase